MRRLEVGDLVFIKRNNFFYKKIAETTNSWTSHVGMIYQKEGDDILVAESCFPFSKLTPFDSYINRSENGIVCVMRLKEALNHEQKSRLRIEVVKRLGKFYTWGYNYESKHQFCSKFIREIYEVGIGVELGEIETFSDIAYKNPNFPKSFWNKVFLGKMPYSRKTVTPYSLYCDESLETLYDNFPKSGKFQ